MEGIIMVFLDCLQYGQCENIIICLPNIMKKLLLILGAAGAAFGCLLLTFFAAFVSGIVLLALGLICLTIYFCYQIDFPKAGEHIFMFAIKIIYFFHSIPRKIKEVYRVLKGW